MDVMRRAQDYRSVYYGYARELFGEITFQSLHVVDRAKPHRQCDVVAADSRSNKPRFSQVSKALGNCLLAHVETYEVPHPDSDTLPKIGHLQYT